MNTISDTEHAVMADLQKRKNEYEDQKRELKLQYLKDYYIKNAERLKQRRRERYLASKERKLMESNDKDVAK